MSVLRFAQRHDLHGRVPHLVEKAVDDRAAPENVPAGTRGLAEDDVRDALAAGEADERVGDLALGFGPQADDPRPEAPGEGDVLLQRGVVFRPDPARLLPRRLDVDGVPVRGQPPGDARARAQELSGAPA